MTAEEEAVLVVEEVVVIAVAEGVFQEVVHEVSLFYFRRAQSFIRLESRGC